MGRASANQAIVYAFVLVACFILSSMNGSARQARSLSDGVYADAQAERARPLYQQQCALCHGDQLQGGGTGTPLNGSGFLATWSGRPLSELADKIHKTMPFNAPGTLSRQQAIDLTALVLQAGMFPSGRSDLAEGALAGVRLPTVRGAAPAPVPSSSQLPPPVGNLAEVMRAIAFYNSNIIFNTPVRDPATAPKPPLPIPFDYVQWGYTIYPGWLAVDQAAVALTETAHLLMTPGRQCQNGRVVPIDRPDWRPFVDDLARVGKELYAASKARDYDKVVALSDNLNETCANCHKIYRDAGGLEGSGARRCQGTP
jgi:mono/diheme cytochrome c family protein